MRRDASRRLADGKSPERSRESATERASDRHLSFIPEKEQQG